MARCSLPGMPGPLVSVVILTQGDRPDAFRDACRSVVAALPGAAVEFVVVWNTTAPPPPDVLAPLAGPMADPMADVVVVHPGENLGIPGGRNLGAARASSDLVLFLDDDAELLDDRIGSAIDAFTREPRLGVVALRLVDETGVTLQRHVPRVGGRSAERPGHVALFLGGASIHRRSAFLSVGGYAAEFFYAMEESDLALRVIDAGWDIWYEPSVRVFHPHSSPTRHPGAIERTARNRVWLAQRNLPLPFAVAYVAVWSAITSLRNLRHRDAVRASWAGTVAGVRNPLGPRRPIRWRTVWRLTRLGRPPLI